MAINPRRHRFTVDEYYAMGLPADARTELIEGDIIDMSPIGSPHAGITDQLSDLLRDAAGSLARVRVQQPMRLGPHNEPQPDLALVKPRPDYYRGAHPTAPDTYLVVEIADNSLAEDLNVKVPLYARHAIPEVWVLDVNQSVLHVFCGLYEGKYTDADVVKAPSARDLTALPVRVDLSALWR